ncbi:uncharacterized protein LOC141641072 [Silene latifolia]|uniref:uncharacterized protein LOC141641072 n=1 Tax=Silene latifolia TaxID=37657 RepID=UPI003D7810B9
MDSDSTENTMCAESFDTVCNSVILTQAYDFTLICTRSRNYTAKKLRSGIAHQKFIVCNRQVFRGNKQKLHCSPVHEHNNGDSSFTIETVKRRVKITRIGCRAYDRFAFLNGLEGPAMIDEFSEFHNHCLTSVGNRDLEKISRSLDMFYKPLILDNSKLNIGVGKTFRKVKELVHGYENIAATLVDFKNFQRDIKCYIGERDVDLFLDRLEKLKATQPHFTLPMMLTRIFQLEDNEWLSTMFTDRNHWIPAYHRDLPIGCILRTTQRSESANSFFKWYENHFGTLVEFWIRFQIAMEQQRYTQRCDDYDSDHSLPNLDTNIHLKNHGAIVYTHAVFKMLQEEVKAAISCDITDFDKEDNVRIIFVKDAESNRTFKVTFNLSTMDTECAFKLFEKIGLDSNGNAIEDSSMAQSDNSHVCKLWAEFSTTVGVLKTLTAVHMDELALLLVEFWEKLSFQPLKKDQEIEMLLGCSSSSEVTIRPLVKAHNKASGKRLTSVKTQAIEKAATPKRLCAYCKEKFDHDKRTCPLLKADEAAAKVSKKNSRI